MILGHENLSMTNMRRDRIKTILQKDLHSLCEAGNHPATFLLGDDLPKKIGIIKTYLIFLISTATIHRISKPEMGTSKE